MNITIKQNEVKPELDATQGRFIELVERAEERITGSDSYANTIEFYDEDGIVVMTVDYKDTGKAVFTFMFEDMDDEESFEYEETKVSKNTTFEVQEPEL